MSAAQNLHKAELAGALQQLLTPSQRVTFAIENLQHLSLEEALLCQSILGHGNVLGVWETPKETFGHVDTYLRKVDLRARINDFLPGSLTSHPALPTLLAESLLYLTRYALLLRVGPVGIAKHALNTSMKATTAAHMLYTDLARLVARGIERRLGGPTSVKSGFASALSDEDLLEFGNMAGGRREMSRLHSLVARGLWGDETRSTISIRETTPVAGERPTPPPERKPEPHQPLSDEYMEQVGPRVLWLIKDLGPNLISLLAFLVSAQREGQFRTSAAISRRVADYFKSTVWRDRHGQEIQAPPFPLRLNLHGKSRDPNKDAYAWPPRSYADVLSLAATLQRAHLFMALLLMTSRQSEMSNLKRDCVKPDPDGKTYVNGKTYKPSKALTGDDKKWPVPSVLVYAFAQQVNLVQASEQLELLIRSAQSDEEPGACVEMSPQTESMHLWASLGPSGNTDATASLEVLNYVLPALARSIGVDDKPGGVNLHPHRLRKTMARLVGVALDGSQKVVMLLLGHEDVRTSLYYMQTDPAFRQEVEDVIREIRVIRSANIIESMHVALHEPGSLAHAGHGGGGTSVLEQAIVQHEQRLHRTGKRWGAESARELAAILTDNGNSSRMIAPGVVCTKSPGEVGMCTQKRGEVSPSNCKVECSNHIELATNRRDVERVIPILVQDTTAYFEKGEWLAATHSKRQLINELSRFDDIGAQFRAKQDVQYVLGLDPEGGP